MAKNIKLTCNLTSDFRYVSEELYEKLAKQYGSVQNLQKFYVKKEISLLIKRGSNIHDISILHGFEYDKEKQSYYEELVQFHGKEELVKLERKESKTHTIQTDEDVKQFMEDWKRYNDK